MNKTKIDPALLNNINIQQIIAMFDVLPDILFWVKDINCRFIHTNAIFREHKGAKSNEQIIGKTDSDFSPPHLAKQFLIDDQKVMAGELVTGRLEMNLDVKGNIAWFSTTKRPLLDQEGKIIGSYGITRHLEKTSKTLSEVNAISGPVNYIRQHFQEELSIEQLASAVHISISALERRFKKYLSKTPRQFITEMRLEHARKLLIETDLPISEVAFQSGFFEHSYFSKQFKSLFAMLPSELRKNMRK